MFSGLNPSVRPLDRKVRIGIRRLLTWIGIHRVLAGPQRIEAEFLCTLRGAFSHCRICTDAGADTNKSKFHTVFFFKVQEVSVDRESVRQGARR